MAAAEEERQIAALYSVPDDDGLARLLRYQAQNDRRLERACTRLERRQRLRRGEYVPAPLKVEVEGVQ